MPTSDLDQQRNRELMNRFHFRFDELLQFIFFLWRSFEYKFVVHLEKHTGLQFFLFDHARDANHG